jgi:hypothetical protein
MSEPDDNLQKILFGEVKEMTLDIEDFGIDLSKKSKKNKKFDDEIEFFKNNYNKTYTNKYFYESYDN